MTAVTCRQLEGCLEQALDDYAEQIVVDLRGLRSLDAGGMHTILVAHLRAVDDHRQLLLIPGSPGVQGVLDRTHAPFRYARPPY